MKRSESGFALMQVLVMGAITLIVIVSYLAISNASLRENQAVFEKLGTIDVNRIASGISANHTKCSQFFLTSNLQSPSSMPFDASTATAAHPVLIGVHSVPFASLAVGAPASQLQSTLIVKNIVFEVISQTVANLRISFEPSTLVRSLQDIVVPNIELATTGPITSETIMGCGTSAKYMMCLGGCGGLWPNVVGAMTLYNWDSHDNSNYWARGNSCANTTSTWINNVVGGGGHHGSPFSSATSMYWCSQ